MSNLDYDNGYGEPDFSDDVIFAEAEPYDYHSDEWAADYYDYEPSPYDGTYSEV